MARLTCKPDETELILSYGTLKVGDFHFKLVNDYGREWAFTKEELENESNND